MANVQVLCRPDTAGSQAVSALAMPWAGCPCCHKCSMDKGLVPNLPELGTGGTPYDKGPFVCPGWTRQLGHQWWGPGGMEEVMGRRRWRYPFRGMQEWGGGNSIMNFTLTPSCKDIKVVTTHNVTTFLLEKIATLSCRAWEDNGSLCTTAKKKGTLRGFFLQ